MKTLEIIMTLESYFILIGGIIIGYIIGRNYKKEE
jgi:hypothetical protein